MKCPKCGYVGFEQSVRCRHCGYDFSLTGPASALLLRSHDPAPPASAADEFFSANEADPAPSLDRLGFVDLQDDAALAAAPDLPLAEVPLSAPPPAEERRLDRLVGGLTDAPPPARPPLAVRRNAERPRSRPTTQVLRRSPSSLLDTAPAAEPEPDAVPVPAGPPAPAGLVARGVAGLIDLTLLAAIALAVVYFTVRLSGLTMSEVAQLPPVPLGAFLIGQALAYLAAFTACGGQTLGKMALGVRVVADDGAVPPGAAVMRACTALAGVALAGLGLLPALFDGDHRGLHDRVAGTRVVRA